MSSGALVRLSLDGQGTGVTTDVVQLPELFRGVGPVDGPLTSAPFE